MKWLYLLLSCPSFLLANPTPNDTALTFLETIRSPSVTLSLPLHTAISPVTTEEKKSAIISQLQHVSLDITHTTLTPQTSFFLDSLGVVLVSSHQGYNIDRFQVLPVTMIRTNERWLPTPSLGSFKNCGLGYDETTLKQIQKIESWIQENTEITLNNLRSQILTEFQSQAAQTAEKHHLSSLAPDEILHKFLTACSTHDFFLAAALCNLHQSPPTPEWVSNVKVLDDSIHKNIPPNAIWRGLCTPSLITFPMSIEVGPTSCTCNLATIMQSSIDSIPCTPFYFVVPLELQKSPQNSWYVKLRPTQLERDSKRSSLHPLSAENLLDVADSQINHYYPAKTFATSHEASSALLAALKKPEANNWLSFVGRSDNAYSILKKFGIAVSYGYAFHNTSKPGFPIFIEGIQIGDAYCCLVYPFTPLQSDTMPRPHMYLFEKTSNGWIWNTNPNLEETKPFIDWETPILKTLDDQWPKYLLQPVPILPAIPTDSPPTVEESIAVVQKYRDAIRLGDLDAALATCARIDNFLDPTKLIRNFSYDLIQFRTPSAQPPTILGTASQDGITMVATKLTHDNSSHIACYSVTNTPNPKILLGIDLAISTERTRAFLNKDTLSKLHTANPTVAKTIETLYLSLQHKINPPPTEAPTETSPPPEENEFSAQ